MTTLWDKFTQAIAWLRTPTLAAVRTISRTEVSSAPASIVTEEGAAAPAPVGAAFGVHIAGFDEVAIHYEQLNPTSGATVVLLHGYDGSRWVPLKPISLVGTWGRVHVKTCGVQRIYYSVLAGSIRASWFSLYVTPHNEGGA